MMLRNSLQKRAVRVFCTLAVVGGLIVSGIETTVAQQVRFAGVYKSETYSPTKVRRPTQAVVNAIVPATHMVPGYRSQRAMPFLGFPSGPTRTTPPPAAAINASAINMVAVYNALSAIPEMGAASRGCEDVAATTLTSVDRQICHLILDRIDTLAARIIEKEVQEVNVNFNVQINNDVAVDNAYVSDVKLDNSTHLTKVDSELVSHYSDDDHWGVGVPGVTTLDNFESPTFRVPTGGLGARLGGKRKSEPDSETLEHLPSTAFRIGYDGFDLQFGSTDQKYDLFGDTMASSSKRISIQSYAMLIGNEVTFERISQWSTTLSDSPKATMVIFGSSDDLE